MRSLRARLLIASLAVALLAVGITAWAVNRTTSSQVREAIEQDLEAEDLIYEELSFFVFANGSWEGVDGLVGELAARFDERIAITTVDGLPIADSDPGAVLPAAPERFIDPYNPVISFDEPPAVFGGEVGIYSDQVDELIGVLEEAGIPVEVTEGFGLAVPVWDLEDPEALEILGEFLIEQYLGSGTVAVGEGALGPEDMRIILEEGGIPFEEVTGPDGALSIVWDPFDPDVQDQIFDDGSGLFDLGGFPLPIESTEPALLFLGVADQDRVIPDPIGTQLLLIVALVAAVAVIATVLVSRRVLGPVGALTLAARRMGEGDLSERVPVIGSDEMADLAGAFNTMADSLQEQDRLRKTMTSDVAHELRTPLSNIRGYLEAFEEGVVEPTPEMIGSLHEEAVHLQGLVNELQDLSLAESGELRIETQPVDLTALLERTVRAHEPAIDGADLSLSLEAPPGVTVPIDVGRIRQVVGNLLDNAIRHTPSGGAVSIALVEASDRVQITVTDTGTGIDPEHLPHVFDRFYRADSSRSRETGGSGLGLAIAAELVRLHGGSIAVASEAGSGSVFTVTLPR